MKKLRVLFLVICAIICSNSFAAKRTGLIYGFVHDRLTHENLLNTKVSLMKGDSIVMENKTDPSSDLNGRHGLWYFDIDINE